MTEGPTSLVQERDFLLRSLRDLEREREARDISDADYEVLRDRYTAKAASVLRSLGHGMAGDDSAEVPVWSGGGSADKEGAPGSGHAAPVEGRRDGARLRVQRRRWLAVAGGGMVVAGIALGAVLAATGVRAPGGVPTGGRSSSPAQLLGEAEAADASGQADMALALYQQVLARQPGQPEALAEAGWIEFSTGVRHASPTLVAAGQKLEAWAVRVAPTGWAPRLYLGSMQLAEGDASDAVGQLRVFLDEKPPASKVQAALPTLLAAFGAAHEPLPTLPAGTTVPTTPAPTTTTIPTPARP